MPRNASKLLAALGGLCLSFSLIACGPPTLAGAEARYTGNRDKLSAVITRKPQAKAEIEAKVAEFAAEYEKALKETPEEKKIAAIGALSGRMERYLDELEPKPKDSKAGGATAPSDKLDSKTPPPSSGPPVTVDKLGGTPPPSGPPPSGPPPSGMGSAAAPTPTPTPAPTPAPAAAPAAGGMGGM